MLVQITNQWQSLNALTGIPPTVKIFVQSHSSSRIYVAQGALPPAAADDGVVLEFEECVMLTDLVSWVRVDAVAGSVYVESR